MKRTGFMTVLILGFLALLCTTSLAISLNPVNDLSGWQEFQYTPNNPVAITHAGSSMSFIGDGTADEAWGGLDEAFPGSIGITAEVNVSSTRGNGTIGIWKSFATTDSGTSLFAFIYLQRWDDEYRFKYNLQEIDSSGNTIRELGSGFFGKWGTAGTAEWNVGEDVFLGLAVVGNEVWFYTPGYDTLLKVQILTPFTPIDDGNVHVFVSVPTGSANRIEGSVKNVNIVYP